MCGRDFQVFSGSSRADENVPLSQILLLSFYRVRFVADKSDHSIALFDKEMLFVWGKMSKSITIIYVINSTKKKKEKSVTTHSHQCNRFFFPESRFIQQFLFDAEEFKTMDSGRGCSCRLALWLNRNLTDPLHDERSVWDVCISVYSVLYQLQFAGIPFISSRPASTHFIEYIA